MKNYLLLLCSITAAGLSAQKINPDTLPDNQLKQVVVTAQFVPTDTRQTVNAVRVLDRRTIERRAAVNLEELLQTEANIRLSQDAILGSAISINGLRGENVKVLLDGVPVSGRLNGSVDAGQLPMGAVQQVEIIEGAQSLLYGSEAAAGVINLISRKSQAHRVEAEANTLFESNGFRNLQGRVGINLGKFLLQLNGSQLDFRPSTDSALGRDQLWNPKTQSTGRAVLRYTHSKKFDIRLSGGLFEEKVDNLGELRRPQFKPYAFDDYYNTRRADLTLHAEGWLRQHWFWQATSGYNRFDRIKNSYRYDFDTDEQSLIEGQQDTSAAGGWLNRLTIASDHKSRWWNVLLGAENYREIAEGVRIIDSSAVAPGKARNTDLGLFASLKANFWEKKLTLQGGARWTNNQRYGAAVTPSLWALWQIAPKWQLRSSYANGFRSPGLKELYFNFIDINHFIVGNPNLQPERSHNFRTDLSYNPTFKKMDALTLRIQAAGFYNRVRDRIVLAEYAPVQFQYLNLSRWETVGSSAGVTLTYRNWLRFRSEVVYTGFFNTYAAETDSLNTFDWAADWVNDLSLSFMEGKWGLTCWQKTTGRTPYFFEEDGQLIQGMADRWTMLNISFNANLLKNTIRLNTGVKNILNVRQIRTGANGAAHSQGGELRPVHWGRTFFVNVILTWHSSK